MKKSRVYIRILLLSAIISLACTTKVSEWILLNSEPDGYQLVYFHKSALSEQEKKNNILISEDLRSANISFRAVLKNDAERSFYALYYGGRLFNTYNSAEDLKNLCSSVLRTTIAGEIMSGKLCVMVFLKSGDPGKDFRAIATLRQTVNNSPFGKIIPVVELDRNSASEKHLVSMLLNVEDDLKGINEPMLFGVFGRFRALEPLLAKGISEENINLMIDFLTADCSCLIKDDLPGISILYNGTWENPMPALANSIIDSNPLLDH